MSSYLTPTFQPFQSSGGICYASKDYAGFATPTQNGGAKKRSTRRSKSPARGRSKSMRGGGVKGGNYSNDSLIPTTAGEDHYKAPTYEKPMGADFISKNLGAGYATAFGGAKKKKSRSKSPAKKRSTRKKRGGAENGLNAPQGVEIQEKEGVTVPEGYKSKTTIFINPTTGKALEYAESINESGKVIYHVILDPTTNPPTISKSQVTNISNLQQEIDKYFKNKSMNGYEVAGMNGSEVAGMNSSEVAGMNGSEVAGMKAAEGGKKKKRSSSKSKKTKKTKKSTRRMRGGSATGLPVQYFDPKVPTPSYSADSGKGAMTAYGPANPKDVGVGMLAPYNTNSNAPRATMMKTGGGGRVPRMSESAVVSVQKVINDSFKGLDSFFGNVENSYNKSVKDAESIKVGDQRLIHNGGKKKKTTKKKTSSKKKTTKRRRSMKGGSGSDYATTLSSRGPVNAPDKMWGVDGEQFFRQFNKTGEYIPNSQLAVAAAPQSTTSGMTNGIVKGYDNLGQSWAPVGSY